MSENKNTGRDNAGATKIINQRILVILGVFFALLILGIILYIPCPTSSQYRIFHLLLSLAAAGIGAIMPGFINVKYKGAVQAGGALGIFIVVYLIEPESGRADTRCANNPFTLTVFVHGSGGIQDQILKSQGSVALHLHSKLEEAPIDEHGSATFKEIAPEFVGQKVAITIDHPQPYQSVNPDSLYKLQRDGVIYVEAALNDIDKIFGRISDATSNDPVDSARVVIKDVFTFSNNDGWFELKIPKEWQAKFQRVLFSKRGYITQDIDSIPVHVKQEIQIALKRK
jgi:hypothetical protein